MARIRNDPTPTITAEEISEEEQRAVPRLHIGHAVTRWKESKARKFAVNEKDEEIEFSYIMSERAKEVKL